MSGLSSDPLLILAGTTPDYQATGSPLFAAIRVTKAFLARAQELHRLCEKHDLAWIQTQPIDHVHWDFPPGSTLDGCTDLSTSWHTLQDCHYFTLAGRTVESGGDAIEDLAGSVIFDTAQLNAMRDAKTLISYSDHKHTEEVLGQPFALAVHERMVQMRVWPGTRPEP